MQSYVLCNHKRKNTVLNKCYKYCTTTRSECLTCTFSANCCSVRLSRAQVPAFAGSSVRDMSTTVCMNVCMYAHKRLSSQMSEINVLLSNKCSSTLVVGTTSGCSQTLYPKQEVPQSTGVSFYALFQAT